MFSMETVRKNIKFKRIQAVYFPKAYERDKIKAIINKHQYEQNDEGLVQEVVSYNFTALTKEEIREELYSLINKPGVLGKILANLMFKDLKLTVERRV